ncbi:MAG: hypothetical protein ACFFCQ_16435 [Promethearchaeota archaeon]
MSRKIISQKKSGMDLLRDFASFLKMKGRFDEIGYEDSPDGRMYVVARPLFPEIPQVSAAEAGKGRIEVTIHGYNDYITNETIQFFKINQLRVDTKIAQFVNADGTQIAISGRGEPYERLEYEIFDLLEKLEIESEGLQTTIFFDSQTKSKKPVLAKKVEPPKEELKPEVVEEIVTTVSSKQESRVEVADQIISGLSPKEDEVLQIIKQKSTKKIVPNKSFAKKAGVRVGELKKILLDLQKKGYLFMIQGGFILNKEKITNLTQKSIEEKLFPKEKEERGLTDIESIIVNALLERPKNKAQSNLLARSTGIAQDQIKGVLRGLVKKGVVRVSSGWYVLRKDRIQPKE